MRKLAMAFVAAAVLAAPAAAQPPRGGFPGGGMGMMRGGGAALLTNKSVQEELKLTEEQIKKVEEFQGKQGEAMRKLRDVPEDQRREKVQEWMKTAGEESKKFVADTLKPEQAKRFKQIQLQRGGLMAVTRDEEIAKELKLTDEQKEKMKEIAEEMGKDMRELFQGGRNPDSAKKIQAMQKEAADKAAELLTKDQKATWKEMTGAPFEVKEEQRRRPVDR